MATSHIMAMRDGGALSALGNGVLFNVTWLAIVVTHDSQLAPLFAGLFLTLHFLLMGKGSTEARLILMVTVFGFFVDQCLFRIGVFNVEGHPATAPLWMSSIWPVLAATLMHAFEKLQRRHVLAALFGAVGGAASFAAGVRLSEVGFGSAMHGPFIMAALWALLFPFLLWLARVNAGAGGNGHGIH